MCMIYRTSVLAILLGMVAPLVAADPVPGAPEKPRTDAHGDPLPEGAVLRLGSGRFRHVGLTALVFSADGKTLVSAGHDGTIRFWDIDSGKELGRIEHEMVDEMCLPSDGKTIATMDGAGILTIWDTQSKKEILQKQPHGDPSRCSWTFSRDGTTLASLGIHGDIFTYDVKGGTLRKKFEGTYVGLPGRIALSADGKVLAALDDGGVLLLDSRTEKQVQELKEESVQSIVFAPDGASVITSAPGQIAAWSVETGKKTCSFDRVPEKVDRLAFAPDGKTLAATAQSPGGKNMAVLWDPATGKKRRNIVLDVDAPSFLVFSSDSSKLAVGGPTGKIRLWDAASGKPIESGRADGHQGAITRVEVAPDGKLIATGGADGSVRLWDSANGKQLALLEGHQQSLVGLNFSLDGRLLVTADAQGTMLLWDVPSRKLLRTLDVHTGGIIHAGFRRDGKVMSIGRTDNTVRIWDPQTGKEVHSFRIDSPAQGAYLAPNARFVLTRHAGEGIRIWDAQRGNWVSTASVALQRFSFAITGDDRMLCILEGNDHVQVFETFTGKKRFEVTLGANSTGVDISDDGAILASMDPSGEIALWSSATGKELRKCSGHTAGIRTTTFSPDGNWFLTGSLDGTVLVWDLRNLVPRPAPRELTKSDLEKRWSDLAGDDAAVAYVAEQELRAAPESTIRFLSTHLKNNVAPVDTKHLAKLIKDLDNDDFDTRQKASETLAGSGDEAEPVLRKALADNPSPEVRVRLEQLLGKVGNPCANPEARRAWRALAVLERIGGEDSRKAIEKLAAGPESAWLTEEAKAALARLKSR